ncbi:MAG TPA: cupredoxin domain-containing protein [Magnetospirillum sp.]|jgi:hypothetical protein|nr:cupredoxin domain-containing protein [Magnetospirillum sp.]
MRLSCLSVLAVLGALAATPALAADSYELVIKDHRFVPDRLEIPANTKVELLVKNQDPSPEEFESHDLKREKVIKGNSEAKVLVGPLQPGEYKFIGEYNEATAKGVLVAK